jgi:hypothetical protein
MAVPSTGTSWRAGGFNDVDSRFNSRGGLAAILIRDNRGAATNISPYASGSPPTINWSPLALDGQPRADLFANIRVDGEWITNPDPNEGFWLVGALTEDGGPERAPNISEDNQMILQSNFPFDTDLTEEGLSINFTAVETLKPLLKRLRMNLPLTDPDGNSIVEDPGAANFSIGKTIDVESVERQIILLFARRKAGKYLYTAEGYSLCKLTNIGNYRRSKTDPDAGELGYTVLPDPFFVGKDPADPASDELVPILYNEWIGGDGWVVIGGAPVWPGSAPVGTQLTSTTAKVSAEDPVGAGDPFDVTVETSVSPYTVWTSRAITATATDTPTAGHTEYTFGGLTTATTYKARVKAVGTNGQTANSQESNTFTTA